MEVGRGYGVHQLSIKIDISKMFRVHPSGVKHLLQPVQQLRRPLQVWPKPCYWLMMNVGSQRYIPITNKPTYAGKTKVVPLVVCWVINVCSHRDSAILLVKPTSWTIFFSYFADDKCKKACGKCWRKPSLTFWPKEDKTRPLRISFEYNPVLI